MTMNEWIKHRRCDALLSPPLYICSTVGEFNDMADWEHVVYGMGKAFTFVVRTSERDVGEVTAASIVSFPESQLEPRTKEMILLGIEIGLRRVQMELKDG